jgi:hypothetical protein
MIQDMPHYIDNAAFAVAQDPYRADYLVYYTIRASGGAANYALRLAGRELARTSHGGSLFVQEIFTSEVEATRVMLDAFGRFADDQGRMLGNVYCFYQLPNKVILPTSFSPYSTPRILAGVAAKDAQMRQVARDIVGYLTPVMLGLILRPVVQGVIFALDRPTRRVTPVTRTEEPAGGGGGSGGGGGRRRPPPPPPDEPVPVITTEQALRAESDIAIATRATQHPETVYHHVLNRGGLHEILETETLLAMEGTSLAGGGSSARAYFGPAPPRPHNPAVEFTTPVPGSPRSYAGGRFGATWSEFGLQPAIPTGRLPLKIRRITYPDGSVAVPDGPGLYRLRSPDGAERVVTIRELPTG